MQRRTMILSIAGLGVAAYGGVFTAGALAPCSKFAVDNPVFASARRIGERLIALGFEARSDASEDLESQALTLNERAQRDFRSSRTVLCDGWVLSESEARFCIACAKSRDTQFL